MHTTAHIFAHNGDYAFHQWLVFWETPFVIQHKTYICSRHRKPFYNVQNRHHFRPIAAQKFQTRRCFCKQVLNTNSRTTLPIRRSNFARIAIQMPTIQIGTIARIAKRNGKTRCIGLIHNMIPHEPNPIDKVAPPYFVNAMDGFTALSKSVVDDICHFDKHQKPKSWAPHPIYDHYGPRIDKSVARQTLGLKVDARYVLFFGFIRDYKGLDLLIDAFGDFRLHNLDVRLIIAGEFYGDPTPYLDRIRSLDLSDRVVLCNDYIPDDKVNLYFRASDIVAQPYKTATQSGVTQVAFHFEKPMLVTRVGALPEIVPDHKIGYVVDPNPQAIADALVDFYKEQREEAYTEALRVEKQKYGWDRMTSAVLSTLNS